MLGDGRAVLLGEHLVNKSKRFDIQFKGSGKTSFSRSGDGRAVLRHTVACLARHLQALSRVHVPNNILS